MLIIVKPYYYNNAKKAFSQNIYKQKKRQKR